MGWEVDQVVTECEWDGSAWRGPAWDASGWIYSAVSGVESFEFISHDQCVAKAWLKHLYTC